MFLNVPGASQVTAQCMHALLLATIFTKREPRPPTSSPTHPLSYRVKHVYVRVRFRIGRWGCAHPNDTPGFLLTWPGRPTAPVKSSKYEERCMCYKGKGHAQGRHPPLLPPPRTDQSPAPIYRPPRASFFTSPHPLPSTPPPPAHPIVLLGACLPRSLYHYRDNFI